MKLVLFFIIVSIIALINAFQLPSLKLHNNVMRILTMSSESSDTNNEKEWVGAKKFSMKDRYTETIFTNEQISKILPHRYPFLLVDKVVEFVPGKKAVGIKAVTANEPQFTGHFPDRPIMPGVLMIEAMAQLGRD